jgi:hypothetical protein
MQPSEDDLRGLFNGSFANLLHGSWAEWRKVTFSNCKV